MSIYSTKKSINKTMQNRTLNHIHVDLSKYLYSPFNRDATSFQKNTISISTHPLPVMLLASVRILNIAMHHFKECLPQYI
jgi:hypothetical protein